MVSLRFREFLTGYVAEEFDSLVAQLRAFFSVSFHEDGTLIGTETGLGTVPIGIVQDFAGPTAPTGWLVCNGDSISRVTYKSLFEIIATTWGAGDGSTTFNLPDFRGRYRIGKAASGAASTLGGTFGALDHTHTMPAHAHTIATAGPHAHGIVNDGSHTHTGTTGVPDGLGLQVDHNLDGSTIAVATHTVGFITGHGHPFTTSGEGDHDHNGQTDTSGGHDHGGTTGSEGGGATSASNPPSAVVLTIIFAGA